MLDSNCPHQQVSSSITACGVVASHWVFLLGKVSLVVGESPVFRREMA
jgi:hypothetical protein